MMSLSAAILVATCTATFGLHSSSSTTISYSYFDFGSALRSRTARSAELRPPSPFAEVPPVSGPMKPTFTLSFASAAPAATPRTSAAINAVNFGAILMSPPLRSRRLLVGAIGARQAHHGKGRMVHAITLARNSHRLRQKAGSASAWLLKDKNMGERRIDLPQRGVADPGDAAKKAQVESPLAAVPAVVAC